MARKIEDMIQPFSLMTEEEQLELIEKIRYNRFVFRPSMVKTAKKKTTRKSTAKKKDTVKKAVNSLTGGDRAALIAQLKKEIEDGNS